MTNNSDDSMFNLTIRQKAEALLHETYSADHIAEDTDLPKILHELRVHHIELELQNEELRRIRSDLEVAQKKYFNLFNLAPVGYLILDEQGRVVEANLVACEMLHLDRSQLKRKPLLTRLSPDSRPVFRGQLVEVFANRRGLTGELMLQSLEGDQLPVQVEYSIIEHEGSIHCLTTLTDISRLKHTELQLAAQAAALRKTNDDLEQFAYTISHDLREPVRTIHSFGQLLEGKRGNELNEDTADYVGFIADAARRLDQQIKDLHEYSRIGWQQAPLQLTSCEVVLHEVLQNLQIVINHKNAKITHDPLPTLMGRPAQLAVLFQNLIENALKFNRQLTPTIHISATENEREWLLSFRDNGIGISAEFSEDIFQVFRRLHTREQYPGTGIGLAICERVVTQHGGRIWVESIPGAGSAFYFTLKKLLQRAAPGKLIGD